MGYRWKCLDQLWCQRRYDPTLLLVNDTIDGSPPLPSSGADMALAFISHLAGPQFARVLRGQVEVVEVSQGDDPFAAFHDLI